VEQWEHRALFEELLKPASNRHDSPRLQRGEEEKEQKKTIPLIQLLLQFGALCVITDLVTQHWKNSSHGGFLCDPSPFLALSNEFVKPDVRLCQLRA